jgi:hypothetical protein
VVATGNGKQQADDEDSEEIQLQLQAEIQAQAAASAAGTISLDTGVSHSSETGRRYTWVPVSLVTADEILCLVTPTRCLRRQQRRTVERW